ncbi:MAG: amidohydrolase [Bacteroidales bacterium]|nr:amidohydrolase [Bacteroidales bacterium]
MQDLKVTLFQSDLVWENTQMNLDNFSKKFELLTEKTDLIILPEMFNTGFAVEPENVAETISGPTMHWLREKASLLDCVIAGSLIIYDNGNFYNRFVWMQADGFFYTYDKRHLFRMGGEHHKFSSSDKSIVISYKGWKIRPSICYDLRFPVWTKNNFSNEVYDYDLLIYVANWPTARVDVWKTLLKARAIENQAIVVGVNRIGKDGNGLDHCGPTMVINERGEIIAQVDENHEGFCTASLSLGALSDFRKKFTVGLDWDRFEILG